MLGHRYGGAWAVFRDGSVPISKTIGRKSTNCFEAEHTPASVGGVDTVEQETAPGTAGDRDPHRRSTDATMYTQRMSGRERGILHNEKEAVYLSIRQAA